MHTRSNRRRRSALTGSASVAIVALVVALAPSMVSVAAPAPEPSPASSTELPEPAVVMGEYAPADFAAEAATLPPALVEALDRDVDLTPAEYLANSQAAVDAVEVVDALVESGTEVLGSRMDGSTLIVNVPDAAAAEVVESTGAVAELGAPPAIPEDPGAVYVPAHDVYNGQPWYWQDSTYGYQCSVGLNGFRVSDGQRQITTAGHCFFNQDGASMFSVKQGNIKAMSFDYPGLILEQLAGNPLFTGGIGEPVAGSVGFGSYLDVGRIAMTDSLAVAKPSALTWGGNSSGAPLSSAPLPVYGTTKATIGATMCKSGSRTGWTCGAVIDVDTTINAGGYLINSIQAKTCLQPGDSGGLALIGNFAVGINSTTKNVACTDPTYFAGFFPVESTAAQSVRGAYGTSWEPAVTVSTPVIAPAFSGTKTTTSAITGTLANSSQYSGVALYLDGSPTPLRTAPVAADGSWSIPLGLVAAGSHSYSVRGTYGSWSKSAATTTGTFTFAALPSTRLTGLNRYGTGVAISQYFYTDGTGGSVDRIPVAVAYVSTGMNYPDALSAGPAAAHLGGPVLLTAPTALLDEVRDELQRLDPARVIVLGAENSLSSDVLNGIRAALPSADVERITGVDRYSTGRLIVRDAFLDAPGSTGASEVIIANGGNFPDALAAGPAITTVDGAVILVNGAASSVPLETLQLMTDLGVTKVSITGAANSVSTAIENQLKSIYGSGNVVRLTGVDRYGTAVAINNRYFPGPESAAVLATGTGFPDALGGAALAAAMGVPLYTAYPTCVPAATFAELARIQVQGIIVLGGTNTLSANVASLGTC